jgi:Fic family protein
VARWQPQRPFNDLPELPPRVELETKPVLRACVEARAALAALNRSAELIPNPGMLINTLPLLEAQASSEIENIVTTADALFQHMHDSAGTDAATREALRYREALIEGHRNLASRPITTRTAEVVCSRIKGTEMSVRRVPGTALVSAATNEIIYTPPESEARLRDLLANWEKFIHAGDSLEPLVRMAVAHYQFEAIHPFTDGNGRTGRVINSLMLVQMELLGLPILYLSRFIIRNKSDYYRLLLAITGEGDWEPWLLYMVRGVEETARWTTTKIDGIRALEQATAEHLRGRLPKIYSHELVQLLFLQPYCRIANLVESGLVKRQTAAVYLRSLTEAGVLQERSVGREKLFVNTRLMRMLTSEANDFVRFRK